MLPYKLWIKKVVFLGDQLYNLDELVSIMDDIGLIDVFRQLNPNERSFFY